MGDFVEDYRHGKGKLHLDDGIDYEGDFLNGVP